MQVEKSYCIYQNQLLILYLSALCSSVNLLFWCNVKFKQEIICKTNIQVADLDL